MGKGINGCYSTTSLFSLSPSRSLPRSHPLILSLFPAFSFTSRTRYAPTVWAALYRVSNPRSVTVTVTPGPGAVRVSTVHRCHRYHRGCSVCIARVTRFAATRLDALTVRAEKEGKKRKVRLNEGHMCYIYMRMKFFCCYYRFFDYPRQKDLVVGWNSSEFG